MDEKEFLKNNFIKMFEALANKYDRDICGISKKIAEDNKELFNNFEQHTLNNAFLYAVSFELIKKLKDNEKMVEYAEKQLKLFYETFIS